MNAAFNHPSDYYEDGRVLEVPSNLAVFHHEPFRFLPKTSEIRVEFGNPNNVFNRIASLSYFMDVNLTNCNIKWKDDAKAKNCVEVFNMWRDDWGVSHEEKTIQSAYMLFKWTEKINPEEKVTCPYPNLA